MRRIDEHDHQAERLFEMVRDEEPDDAVIDAIATALREAARSEASGGWIPGSSVTERKFGVAAWNDPGRERQFASFGRGSWWACELPGGTIDTPDWFFELPALPGARHE